MQCSVSLVCDIATRNSRQTTTCANNPHQQPHQQIHQHAHKQHLGQQHPKYCQKRQPLLTITSCEHVPTDSDEWRPTRHCHCNSCLRSVFSAAALRQLLPPLFALCIFVQWYICWTDALRWSFLDKKVCVWANLLFDTTSCSRSPPYNESKLPNGIGRWSR